MRDIAVLSVSSASSVGEEPNIEETLARWLKALEKIGAFRSLSSVDSSSRKRFDNDEKSRPDTQAAYPEEGEKLLLALVEAAFAGLARGLRHM